MRRLFGSPQHNEQQQQQQQQQNNDVLLQHQKQEQQPNGTNGTNDGHHTHQQKNASTHTTASVSSSTPNNKKHSTTSSNRPFALVRNSLRRLSKGVTMELSSAERAKHKQQQQEGRYDNNNERHHQQLATTNNGIVNNNNCSNSYNNNGRLLSPSRTFDGRFGSPNRMLGVDRCAGSPAPSYACHSEPSSKSESATTESQLDRSLMQTCTDVKYENRRRPKFAAVVDANFQRQCLQAHNYVRQIYTSASLSWSQELAELAKAWALKLAERGRMLYPELPGIGENIFLLAVPDADRQQRQGHQHRTGDHLTTGTELVAHWAAEARHFNFARPKWSQNCRHFTQMIWRGSLEMGVARHWNTENDCLAIVAFYRPAGNCNFPGEFGANLPGPDEVPDYALEATTLAALTQALNRSDLGDGGFRKGPMPPRIYSSCPPNTTKVLKSLDG